MNKQYYAILGLDKAVKYTYEELKTAYRKMAMKYHQIAIKMLVQQINLKKSKRHMISYPINQNLIYLVSVIIIIMIIFIIKLIINILL